MFEHCLLMHRDAIVIVESEAYRSNLVVETTLRRERAARADHLLADIPVRVSSAVRSLGWSFLPEDNIIIASADMSFPTANLIPATGDHFPVVLPRACRAFHQNWVQFIVGISYIPATGCRRRHADFLVPREFIGR